MAEQGRGCGCVGKASNSRWIAALLIASTWLGGGKAGVHEGSRGLQQAEERAQVASHSQGIAKAID